MNWNAFLKYFLHGFAFSLLFTVITLLWIVIFALLVMIGLILGLIIGLAPLILIIGGLNAVLTSWLWFPVKSGLWNTLVHGFVLFIALLITNVLTVWVPQQALPSIPTTVIAFLVSCFADGYVGKWVAGFWEEEEFAETETREPLETDWRERRLEPRF